MLYISDLGNKRPISPMTGHAHRTFSSSTTVAMLSIRRSLTVFERVSWSVIPSISTAHWWSSNSYDWNNINETRFFGRTFNDVLLDVFYYQLERRLSNTTSTDSSGKHWLRLLLGDQRDPRECLLRYFARFSGVFTTLHQCGVRGGHPVCQREPSRMNLSIVTTTAALPLCDNCTTDLVADEDLLNNETNIEYNDSNSTATKNVTRHRLLLMLVSGPLFACSILAIGIGFLVRYVRTVRGSYSPQRQSLVPSRRRRCTCSQQPPGPVTRPPLHRLYSTLDWDPLHPLRTMVIFSMRVQPSTTMTFNSCLSPTRTCNFSRRWSPKTKTNRSTRPWEIPMKSDI